ncbi:Gti1/Pac2 family-domain-containing protein [Mycena rebaudengoi]|nr:Gti1/Pac2 family-domain-containing protein [Mycena rebaudengoi]
MQRATHPRLHIRDAHDAHVVFEATRQGFLRPITRRLDEGERAMLIQSGAVFVWEESDDALGLKRWTDGRLWSQSRMREPYLFYDEKLGDGPDPPDHSFNNYRFVDGVSRGGAFSSALSHQERSFTVHSGLVKQAYSAWVVVHPNSKPRKWHITAYFRYEDLPRIPTVDQDPCLGKIIVPVGFYRNGKARSRSSTSKSEASDASYVSAYLGSQRASASRRSGISPTLPSMLAAMDLGAPTLHRLSEDQRVVRRLGMSYLQDSNN